MDENYRSISEKFIKGTTTIGVICSDGIVLGADSRATMDTFIASSEAIKVYQINDKVGMTIAGGVGDAEYLVRMVKAQNELYKLNEGVDMSPNAVNSILSIILQENKMMPFYVQVIVGGLDHANTPFLYSLDPLGGYSQESKFTSTGSGSLTALGFLEESYKKEKTTKEVIKDVAKALQIAMKRDSATGDRITIATITKDGYKEYSGSELDKLLK